MSYYILRKSAQPCYTYHCHNLILIIMVLLTIGGCSLIHKPKITQHFDNMVVMHTSAKILNSGEIGQVKICRKFYSYYQDSFDLITIVSNVPFEDQDLTKVGYAGATYVVRSPNIGTSTLRTDSGKRFHSQQTLKGIIHLPARNLLVSGPTLHEIMHLWVKNLEILPTGIKDHWGFSNVYGQLGGFDRRKFKVLGNDQYSAGNFGINSNGGNSVPYSPLELYLAGLVTSDEVPDTWVLEDGQWLSENGSTKRDQSGYPIFTGRESSRWSIEDIISRLGNRVPNHENSQRSFQMAVILVGNDRYPVTEEDIKMVSRHINLFCRQSSLRDLQGYEKIYNFWEATGGRAILNADSLHQFLIQRNPTLDSGRH